MISLFPVSFFPIVGIDSIGDVLGIVLLWKIVVWVFPIIFATISGLLWLHRKYIKIFKIVAIAFITIILGMILYKTIIVRILYTPSYLAKMSISYSEYEEEDRTIPDNIDHYITWQLSKILEKVPWIESSEEQARYINAFMTYRLSELPSVVGYECLPSISDVIDNQNIEEEPWWLTPEQTDELLQYTGAKDWCKNHNSSLISIRYVSPQQPLLIIYYSNGTIDVMSIYVYAY